MKSVYVTKLFAHDFRNLKQLELTPHRQLNVFYGQNGQGKTNLLEAIAFAVSLKGIRTVKHSADLIAFGQPQAAIRAGFGDAEPFSVEIDIEGKGKRVRMNQKAIRDSSSLHSRAALVTFVPDDLLIALGSASHRRRALDQLTFGLFPAHASIYRQYEKALVERNQILRSPMFNMDVLQSFTQVLVDIGLAVVELRARAMQIWLPLFAKVLSQITCDTIVSEMSYACSAATKDAFLSRLEQLRGEERARKTTLCGPHLDDIYISLGGHPARAIASRGQARAIVLALKLAHLHAIANERQLSPILLLDDVAGELDESNARHLLSTVNRLQAQTFVTTTHLEALPFSLSEHQSFRMENGQLTKDVPRRQIPTPAYPLSDALV